MLIAPASASTLSIVGLNCDGWSVCGEPTSDARLILGALFGCQAGAWPKAKIAKA